MRIHVNRDQLFLASERLIPSMRYLNYSLCAIAALTILLALFGFEMAQSRPAFYDNILAAAFFIGLLPTWGLFSLSFLARPVALLFIPIGLTHLGLIAWDYEWFNVHPGVLFVVLIPIAGLCVFNRSDDKSC